VGNLRGVSAPKTVEGAKNGEEYEKRMTRILGRLVETRARLKSHDRLMSSGFAKLVAKSAYKRRGKEKGGQSKRGFQGIHLLKQMRQQETSRKELKTREGWKRKPGGVWQFNTK